MPNFTTSRPAVRIQAFANGGLRIVNYEGSDPKHVFDGYRLDEAQITATITSGRQVRNLIYLLQTLEPCFTP